MEVDLLYRQMRVFTETPRRARALKVPQLKGNELCIITPTVLPTLAFQVIRLQTWYGTVTVLKQIILS